MTKPRNIRYWLAARTKRDEGTGCLIWQGALVEGRAFGRLPGERPKRIARAVYERIHGPQGPDVAVRLTCGRQDCCELEHMATSTRGAAILAGTGPCAENARKTSCKRGHPFDEANTYVDPSGRRRCRVCTRRMENAWLAAGNRKSPEGVHQCQAVDAA